MVNFGKTVCQKRGAVSCVKAMKALFCRCCCNPIFPLQLRIIDKFSSNNNLNKLVLDHL